MEGSQMKMREALVHVLRLANVTADGENWDWNNAIAENVVKIVKAALTEPLRQCDVGTAEEQYRRFCDMCSNKDVNQCAYCEFRRTFNLNCSRDKCFAKWAQMPYKAKKGECDA